MPPFRRPLRTSVVPARVCLVALLIAAGCGAVGQRSVAKVPLDQASPPALSESADTRSVLASVAWVIVNRLGLPLSSPLHAYFYASQEAFELGLVTDARTETWFAKDQARFAWGVGSYYGIFLREDKLVAAPLLARVGLVAHELTHVGQYALAGGRRGSSDQWLREGMAEWARFRVLEHFGLRPYAESKRRVLQEARRVGSVERLPSLLSLVGNREWTAIQNQSGRVATYAQAFLAFDLLVERRGSAAALDYFRRFGRVDDRAANFEAAFGLPVAQFATEFRAWLSDALRS